MRTRIVPAAILLAVLATTPFRAAAPIQYRFSFPEPQHRWMQVAASFSDLGAGPLELRMSRSSPGRYVLHSFAKNVYDLQVIDDGDGRELPTTRPDESGWTVPAHGPRVTVRYKVYGDWVDGTYLAIDTTHAHINMPAAILWARGLDDRPATLTFDRPAGARWHVATQLHPGATPLEFTAPNLQYLMDSPAEFGPVAMRQFVVGGRTFRFALHHTGTDAELDSYVKGVEQIVRQELAIYGELPQYEPGTYTFLADYLPYAHTDGMEHRNSSVLTASTSIAADRFDLLGTVAHELFHSWNVERIRPRSLEPFDFDRANVAGELWLAEGFTSYYEPLVLQRAGLADVARLAADFTSMVDAVIAGPGRLTRSAVEMSRMAPFVDGGRPADRTNWTSTVLSYYTVGAAIGLALDLSLRDRSGGRVSLDDYMRALWREFGKPGGSREGYVDRPYTLDDAEAALAKVTGDAAFAREFFARYIAGHDVADYARLLAEAGFVVRRRTAARAWLGDVDLEPRRGGAVVRSLVAPTWPIYRTGIEQDDLLGQLDGTRIDGRDDLAAVLRRHRPDDRLAVTFTDRAGAGRTGTVVLGNDPHVEVVPIESAGGTLSDGQRAFRAAWLHARR